MSLSKETEVIFDVRRGKDYDSANPPLYDSSTFHQKVLGGETQYDYARSGNPFTHIKRRGSCYFT